MMNSNALSTLNNYCELYPIIKKFLPKYEFKFFGFEGDKQQTLFFNNKEHKIIQIIKKDSYDNKIQISHIDNNENYFRDDDGPENIEINHSYLHLNYGCGSFGNFKSHNYKGPAEKRFILDKKEASNYNYFIWAINSINITNKWPIVLKDKLYYQPQIYCDLDLLSNETFKSLDDLVIIKNHNNHLINQALILETSLFNREYGKYISELFKQNKIGA